MLIFGLLIRNYEKSIELPTFMQKADVQRFALLQYVQDNFSTVTLNQVAEKFHYTPEYTSCLFKSTTGKSFTQILQQVRLEKAQVLLQETNAHDTNRISEKGDCYLNGILILSYIRISIETGDFLTKAPGERFPKNTSVVAGLLPMWNYMTKTPKKQMTKVADRLVEQDSSYFNSIMEKLEPEDVPRFQSAVKTLCEVLAKIPLL